MQKKQKNERDSYLHEEASIEYEQINVIKRNKAKGKRVPFSAQR